MFTLRKVWFRRPVSNWAQLNKHEKYSILKNLTFDRLKEPRGSRFYFSPMPLIAQTAQTGTLGGKMTFYNEAAIPVLSDELLDDLKTGKIEMGDIVDADVKTTLLSCLPATEKERFYTMHSAHAICFEDLIIRIGDKDEMTVALEAFNSVISACESCDCQNGLEGVDYSHLFEHYMSGSNWIGLAGALNIELE